MEAASPFPFAFGDTASNQNAVAFGELRSECLLALAPDEAFDELVFSFSGVVSNCENRVWCIVLRCAMCQRFGQIAEYLERCVVRHVLISSRWSRAYIPKSAKKA